MNPQFSGREPEQSDKVESKLARRRPKALTGVEDKLATLITWALILVVFGGVSLCSMSVFGQNAPNAAYEAGSLDNQLLTDPTFIPVGMGALLLPALTDATLEPPAVILSNGKRVATIALGERAVLPPGEYEVVVGHGDLNKRPRQKVTVIDGVTTPVPAFYGALRVEIVQKGGNLTPKTYLLTNGADIWGPTKSSKSTDYKSTSTWLLPEGNISIVVGSSANSDVNRLLISIQKGKVLRYRIVMDGDQIVRSEVADQRLVEREKWWRLRWTLGADASVNRSSNQLSNYNGDILRVGAFTDAELGIDWGNNLMQLRLGIDQSWVGLDSQNGSSLPFQKMVDEATAQILYTYRLGRIFGPYVRARGRTSFFDSRIYLEEDTTVSFDGKDSEKSAGAEILLFNAFQPSFHHVGGGLGISPIDNEYLTVFARGGVGHRWAFFGQGNQVLKNAGGRLELGRLSDDMDFGLEADAEIELRLFRSLRLGATLEMFVPQGQILEPEKFDFKPEFRVGGLANLSLNSFASLIYRISVHRDSTQIDDLQMLNGLQLRIQHSFF